MVYHYEPKEKRKVVKLYFQYKNYAKVRAKIDRGPKPTNRTIRRWVDEFVSGDSLEKTRKGPKRRSVLTAEILSKVKRSVKKEPKLSVRQRMLKLKLKRTSMQNALRLLNFRAYQARTRLDLLPRHCEERLRCAQDFLRLLNGNGNVIQKLCFTDEKFFRLGGELNLHNMVWYSDTNPNYRIEKRSHYTGIMVWCAVTWDGLIGPLFPEGNINAQLYHDMFTNEFLPRLCQLTTTKNTWFQQDGAGAHTAQTTVEYLNRVFGSHWIGKGSTHTWPAGSPDLTVPDYWLWNRLLQDISRDAPATKAALKTSIIRACEGVRVEECQQAILGFRHRIEECVKNGGKEVRLK
jgi:hypothetical protein